MTAAPWYIPNALVTHFVHVQPRPCLPTDLLFISLSHISLRRPAQAITILAVSLAHHPRLSGWELRIGRHAGQHHLRLCRQRSRPGVEVRGIWVSSCGDDDTEPLRGTKPFVPAQSHPKTRRPTWVGDSSRSEFICEGSKIAVLSAGVSIPLHTKASRLSSSYTRSILL